MKDCIKDKKECKTNNKTFVGACFLIIGIALLGRNFDFIPGHLAHIIFSWQMLLIVLGILLIAARGKAIGGLFLVGIGSIFLWDELLPFSPFQWKIVWPALFLFVGFVLVLGYLSKSNKKSKLTAPKKKKSKYDNIEFDIDKIEPIED